MAKKTETAKPKASEVKHIQRALRGLAVPMDSLTRDPANTNIHDERNLATIAASMESFGMDQPLVVQKEGMIIRKGNGRHEAAERLGWKWIPALVVDEGNVEAVMRSIADNQAAKLSRFDPAALARTLKALQDTPGVDETVSGFTPEEIGRLVARVTELTLEGGENGEGGPDGAEAGGGPAGRGDQDDKSHVRMVQLFLDDRDSFPEFQRLVERLSDALEIDNATDCVLGALRIAVGALDNDESRAKSASKPAGDAAQK